MADKHRVTNVTNASTEDQELLNEMVRRYNIHNELVKALEVVLNSMCAHCTTPKRCPGECLTYHDANETLARAKR